MCQGICSVLSAVDALAAPRSLHQRGSVSVRESGIPIDKAVQPANLLPAAEQRSCPQEADDIQPRS
jgi:hypothetical protein